MATKPTDTGRFGQTAGGSDASNIVAPTSGLRDTGWPTNAVPTSGNLNYLEALAFKWRAYLSDGAFSGPVTFDNTVSIAGTLGVTGRLTPSGGTSAFTSSGLITANAGVVTTTLVTTDNVTIGAGRNLIFAGSGIVSQRLAYSVPISAPRVAATLSGINATITGTQVFMVPLLVPTNPGGGLTSIIGIQGRVNDGGTDQCQIALYKSSLVGGIVSVAGFTTFAQSLGTGTNDTIQQNGLTAVTDPDFQYFIAFRNKNGVGTSVIGSAGITTQS